MHLERLLVSELPEPADVSAGRDHQMAGGVGVLVEEGKFAVASVHEERVGRVHRVRRLCAERAALLLVRLRDVLEPPRRPQGLRHAAFLPSTLAVAAALAVGCAACGTQGAEPPRSTAATVDRVGDGDTLQLASGTRVRLVQIDAPELGEGECYAREALRELQRLAPQGARVELETDSRLDDVDRFGGLLRYVRVGPTDLNVELVRRGAAAPYFFRDARGAHADELLDAVASARAARRGMWGACRVEWRRDRPVDTRSG